MEPTLMLPPSQTPTLVVHFRYQHRSGPAVDGAFSMPSDKHSITVLAGPSGSGKTTILRCLAGLERPQSGRISFGEKVWFDSASRVCLSPQQRRIGYVFQDYALFPHLSVGENIAYGLNKDQRGTSEHWLEKFGITDLKHRRPHQISGGEQQRVALARSLATNPQLLLLDEPLSALDTGLRTALREELRQHLRSLALPVVLVTHDQAEAKLLADQVVSISKDALKIS